MIGAGMYSALRFGESALAWVTQQVREYFFQEGFWYMPQAISRLYFSRPLRWLAGGKSEIDGGGVESLFNASWNTLGNYLYGIIPGYCQMVFAIVACTYADVWLGLIAVTFVGIELWLGRRMNNYMHKEMKPAIDIYKRAAVQTQECWHNADHVKSHGVEGKVEQQIKAWRLPGLVIDDRVWRVFFARQRAWHQLRMLVAAVALYSLLAYLVGSGQIAVPLAVLVFFSFERISDRLGQIFNEQRDVQANLARVNKYRPILERVSPIVYDVGEWFEKAPMSVTFNNVSHTVGDDEDEKVILKNVSLHIEAGTRVGVIGPSGAGKSQLLLHLLVRGSDPTEGTVSVGGQDLSTLRMDSLLRYYGNVLQKSEPFTGTIFDNLLFGVSHFDLPDDDDTDAWSHLRSLAVTALNKAGLPPTEFEHGLDESVGYKGLKLSGGQQQRLQIAGALFKLSLTGQDEDDDIGLVLADEPTAALDSLSEQTVMEGLDELPDDTTMLMVAHRLSTVANMDKIVFVRPLSACDDHTPQVTMHDTLAELYAAEPLFREMANAQGFVPYGIQRVA
jgi:ABC-type multidrug transport system fused ATPase/permease subunit